MDPETISATLTEEINCLRTTTSAGLVVTDPNDGSNHYTINKPANDAIIQEVDFDQLNGPTT